MASVLSKYVVLLEAQTAKYQRELEGAQKKLARFETQNKKSLDNIKKGFAAFGVALGVREIARFVVSVTDASIKMQQFERALKVATGSSEGAQQEFSFIRKTADDLGLSLENTAGSYAKLAAAARGTTLQGQASRDIFVGISEAARVLGMSAEQTGGALTAIEQIISKGKVSAEELRGQLGERLPGAFQIAARSIGVTTAELDKMLKAGELTAEELLPALAKELHKTFGPEVEAAANDAQAAINRFSTAIFDLKVAIADSGILDAMASLANLGAATARGFGAAFFGANPFPFEQEIEEAREKIAGLEKDLDRLNSPGFAGPGAGAVNIGPSPATERIKKEIAETEALIDSLINKQKKAFGLVETRRDPAQIFASFDSSNAVLDEVFAAQEKALDAQEEAIRKAVEDQEDSIQKLFQSYVREYETAEEEVARLMAEFDLVAHMFPEEKRAEIRDAIRQSLFDGIEEIDMNSLPKMRVSEMVEDVEEVNDAAQQLGLTFTSAFEDAIVEGGKLSEIFKGLLKDLARMLIRKTLLEPLIGGFTGLLEGKASGGPVGAGTPYVVGEEGPEIFVPRASGNIIPNGAGGVVINLNQSIQAGLPPQWTAQLMGGARIAASSAKQELQKEFAGRR